MSASASWPTGRSSQHRPGRWSPRRPAIASSLNRSTAPAILRDLETGNRPLTHATLDELPTGKPVEHLRSILVSVGTLPPRDEQMTRLERWITRVIAERPDPDQQQLLHRPRRLARTSYSTPFATTS